MRPDYTFKFRENAVITKIIPTILLTLISAIFCQGQAPQYQELEKLSHEDAAAGNWDLLFTRWEEVLVFPGPINNSVGIFSKNLNIFATMPNIHETRLQKLIDQVCLLANPREKLRTINNYIFVVIKRNSTLDHCHKTIGWFIKSIDMTKLDSEELAIFYFNAGRLNMLDSRWNEAIDFYLKSCKQSLLIDDGCTAAIELSLLKNDDHQILGKGFESALALSEKGSVALSKAFLLGCLKSRVITLSLSKPFFTALLVYFTHTEMTHHVYAEEWKTPLFEHFKDSSWEEFLKIIGEIYSEQVDVTGFQKSDTIEILNKLGNSHIIGAFLKKTGDSWYASGNILKAVENYFFSLKLNPDKSSLISLASCLVGLPYEMYDESLLSCIENESLLVEDTEDYIKLHQFLAVAYEDHGFFKEAIDRWALVDSLIKNSGRETHTHKYVVDKLRQLSWAREDNIRVSFNKALDTARFVAAKKHIAELAKLGLPTKKETLKLNNRMMLVEEEKKLRQQFRVAFMDRNITQARECVSQLKANNLSTKEEDVFLENLASIMEKAPITFSVFIDGKRTNNGTISIISNNRGILGRVAPEITKYIPLGEYYFHYIESFFSQIEFSKVDGQVNYVFSIETPANDFYKNYYIKKNITALAKAVSENSDPSNNPRYFLSRYWLAQLYLTEIKDVARAKPILAELYAEKERWGKMQIDPGYIVDYMQCLTEGSIPNMSKLLAICQDSMVVDQFRRLLNGRREDYWKSQFYYYRIRALDYAVSNQPGIHRTIRIRKIKQTFEWWNELPLEEWNRSPVNLLFLLNTKDKYKENFW